MLARKGGVQLGRFVPSKDQSGGVLDDGEGIEIFGKRGGGSVLSDWGSGVVEGGGGRGGGGCLDGGDMVDSGDIFGESGGDVFEGDGGVVGNGEAGKVVEGGYDGVFDDEGDGVTNGEGDGSLCDESNGVAGEGCIALGVGIWGKIDGNENHFGVIIIGGICKFASAIAIKIM